LRHGGSGPHVGGSNDAKHISGERHVADQSKSLQLRSLV